MIDKRLYRSDEQQEGDSNSGFGGLDRITGMPAGARDMTRVRLERKGRYGDRAGKNRGHEERKNR